jgi:hypothetical protein
VKNKEFDNILNDCLERLLLDGESLEQCLEHYPAQAAELKPLLETALAAREAAAIQPRPDFRARARYQFNSALKEVAAGKSRSSWGWFPRWATALAVVLVLVLAGGGTVAAAGSSMPDSPLYSVKLATEQVRLTLATSQENKVKLCVELADERVVEIAYMAEKGDAQQVERVTRRLDDKLELLVALVGEGEAVTGESEMLMAPPPTMAPATTAPPTTTPPTTTSPTTEEALPGPAAVPQQGKDGGGWDDTGRNGNGVQLKERLAHNAAHNRAVLRSLLDRVPESTRDALRQAIDVSEAGYEEVLEALEALE